MHKVLYVVILERFMKDLLVINKNVIEDVLYYKDEPMIATTINYPSFESKEFDLCSNLLNNYYYTKLALHSKYEIYSLYRLAMSEYEYALANGFPFREYEYYSDFSVTYKDNCTISLYFYTYTYTGGAHGATVRTSDTWNLQECKLMSLSDYIVDRRNYKDFIIDEIIYIIEESKETGEYMYFDDYEQLVKETFQKDSFYLTNEGIIIYFQQYDIAPYSSGIPDFLISFSNMNVNTPSCTKY